MDVSGPMKVIIAEKPSLARNIVSAIDPSMAKKDGYYENSEYIVTYAFGHLFQLYDVEMYRSDYRPDQKYPWKLEELPFFPEAFRFGLTREEGIIRQYKIIRNLINREDAQMLINAGDSDREGEIIVRIILQYALKQPKDIRRLWMPDQTPQTIRSELEAMKKDEAYDALANEGFARTFVDWCYGINLTRFATVKARTLLRVGRVITPIVQAVYDREMSIVNFVPRTYYVLVSKEKTSGEEVELVSKIEFGKDELDKAKSLADAYNKETAVVTAATSEKKTIPPGKLYSLSKLQGELGKKYKMSLDRSLKIVQDLYEKGYVSYPRTPSQYLAENEKDKFRKIIRNFQELGVAIAFRDGKQIFDDSKIESHSALTPTYRIPRKSDLSEEEYRVYQTIVHRFFSVFCKEPCVVSRTTIEIALGDQERFRLSGDIVLSKGWTAFEEREKKDRILPNLKVGDKVKVCFRPVEKESKPPKRYSVESLNNFLKNPFRDKKEKPEADDSLIQDDSEEYRAMFEGVELGTEATRSGIIHHAIESGYISLKDNTYRLEPNGKYYIETLQKLKMTLPKEKTAELGRSLKKVYKGEMTIDQALSFAKEEIRRMIEASREVEAERAPRIFEVEKSRVLCKCPKCGNSIAVTENGFRCCYSACGLSLYKDNRLLQSLNKKLTKTLAKEIFTKGKIELKDQPSKSGGTYDATLVADFSSKYVSFRFVFPDRSGSSEQK